MVSKSSFKHCRFELATFQGFVCVFVAMCWPSRIQQHYLFTRFTLVPLFIAASKLFCCVLLPLYLVLTSLQSNGNGNSILILLVGHIAWGLFTFDVENNVEILHIYICMFLCMCLRVFAPRAKYKFNSLTVAHTHIANDEHVKRREIVKHYDSQH